MFYHSFHEVTFGEHDLKFPRVLFGFAFVASMIMIGVEIGELFQLLEKLYVPYLETMASIQHLIYKNTLYYGQIRVKVYYHTSRSLFKFDFILF
jgi:hypothetical protein